MIASAPELVDRFQLAPSDLVIEIGSGSGSFLSSLRECGPRVLGVEAENRNVVQAFREGIDTIQGEFTAAVADSIRQRYGPARLVVLRVESTSELLAAACSCLTQDGTVFDATVAERTVERQRAA